MLPNTTGEVKAKFHYASQFGAGSEPASVMEFGFKNVEVDGVEQYVGLSGGF